MLRLENPVFKLAGTSSGEAMHWTRYALALLAFNALGQLAV